MEAKARGSAWPRVVAAVLLAACVLLLVSTASASATLLIESPQNEGLTNANPAFSGSTGDVLVTDPISVVVHEGSSPSGPTVTMAGPVPAGPEGHWSVAVGSGLGEGSYTAVAEQTEAALAQTATSPPVTFTVIAKPPTVVLNAVATPSGDAKPAFSGTASEKTPVVVHVHRGSTVSGEEVASVEVTGTGGSWSAPALTAALADGEYTAVAVQESAVGNGPGTSNAVTFEVDTKPPTVTLQQPRSPSNNRAPTFAGTATAETDVIVHIHEGTTIAGAEVASASAVGTGGGWSSSAATPELASGVHTYTAVATQVSPLGNPTGESNTVTFSVNTEPPGVRLNRPPTPSKNTTPSFTGTATDTTPVTVHVHKGSSASGEEVASVSAAGTGGEWSSAALGAPLADGVYTAVATQGSSLGNGTGTSDAVTFEVDTKPPALSLQPPATPSHNTQPAFGGIDEGAGTGSEPITVRVYEGTTASGPPVAEVTAKGVENGSWSSSAASLPAGEHAFTAVAEQESALGNGPGRSNAVTFVVDTEPPKLTLDGLTTPSRVTSPSFSGHDQGAGTGSRRIVVKVFKGTTPTGEQVGEVSTNGVEGGSWKAGEVTLASGEQTYTAIAEQESTLGNGTGRSNAVTFVVDTEPPKLELNAQSTPTNVTRPTFSGGDSGAAVASKPIVVRVYEGRKAEGTKVAEVSAPGVEGGAWSVPANLPEGEHVFTAVASQESPLGNASATSAPTTFVVDTEPPKVKLDPVPNPSNVVEPSFGGTDAGAGAGTRPVVVRVYEGSTTGGKLVAEKSAAGVEGGTWSTGRVRLATGEHTYTAIAEQESALGNPIGKSATATFVVDTEAPKLTLNGVPTPSNVTKPSFSGGDSGAGTGSKPIVVRVFEGATSQGNEVARLTTAGVEGGSWSVAPSSALPEGEHTFTAVAEQESAIGNAAGKSPQVMFVVDTEPPKPTLEAMPTPSNDTEPLFKGTDRGVLAASRPIVVHVYEGSKPEGTQVAQVSTAGVEGGPWSLHGYLPSGEHTFTAIARQASALGNAEGRSSPTTFFVNTNPPKVSLNPLPLRSSNRHPSFSGTASETTSVTVKVYRGHEASGTPFVALKAAVSGGVWKTAPLSTSLEEGEYTAQAWQPSSLAGNPEGHSEATTFTINLKAPTVVLNQPVSPNSNQTPTFSGTASGKEPVTVDVYLGTRAEGTIVATATSKGGGTWTTGALSRVLLAGEHTYTAVATEASEPEVRENPPGVSAPVQFVVDTLPPQLTLHEVPARSNDATPSFSGTTNDPADVLVSIYEGATAEGAPVTKLTGTVAEGRWSTPNASPALRNGTYTAVATQTSSIGNGTATAAPVTFEVDTRPPTVTLKEPPSPSSNRTPSFSGTASEEGEVTVEIYDAKGHLVASAPAKVEGGEWATAKLASPLEWGAYTAVATLPSRLGNPDGRSTVVDFTLERIAPVVVSGGATEVTRGTARLTGTINPELDEVGLGACRFEYGTTPAYGHDAECAVASEGAGFPLVGSSPTAVFARIYELDPNVTYHYRLVASDEGGTGFGADQSFRTLPPRFAEGEQAAAASAGSSGTATGTGASGVGARGVAASIALQLVPPHRKGTIARLLRTGVYSAVIALPEAGTVVYRWEYVTPVRKEGRKALSDTLVAAGTATLHAPGRTTIRIHLTARGRALLAHAQRIVLTGASVFTPTGETGAKSAGSFELRR